ncbi:MAG: hypothetical protein JWN60_1485 [Acidobacteria bacterium]|nr:hypothetical protein [Acidobacteriota bacterium]
MNTDSEMIRKLSIIFLLILAICFSNFSCGYNNKIAIGSDVAAKIEIFRNKNGKLPNSLTEIGIEESESGPIYYEKQSESKYILWFGKELGETVTYDSETKQWK